MFGCFRNKRSIPSSTQVSHANINVGPSLSATIISTSSVTTHFPETSEVTLNHELTAEENELKVILTSSNKEIQTSRISVLNKRKVNNFLKQNSKNSFVEATSNISGIQLHDLPKNSTPTSVEFNQFTLHDDSTNVKPVRRYLAPGYRGGRTQVSNTIGAFVQYAIEPYCIIETCSNNRQGKKKRVSIRSRVPRTVSMETFLNSRRTASIIQDANNPFDAQGL